MSDKCTLDVKTKTNTPKECDLYKLKEQISSTTNIKDIKFGEKVETSAIKDIALNDLYVLNLKEQSFNIKNTDSPPLIYYWEKTDSEGKKTKVSARFKPSFLLSSEESFNKDSSKPIILA